MFHYYNDKVVFLSDAIYLLISLKFTLCVRVVYEELTFASLYGLTLTLNELLPSPKK